MDGIGYPISKILIFGYLVGSLLLLEENVTNSTRYGRKKADQVEQAFVKTVHNLAGLMVSLFLLYGWLYWARPTCEWLMG